MPARAQRTKGARSRPFSTVTFRGLSRCVGSIITLPVINKLEPPCDHARYRRSSGSDGYPREPASSSDIAALAIRFFSVAPQGSVMGSAIRGAVIVALWSDGRLEAAFRSAHPFNLSRITLSWDE